MECPPLLVFENTPCEGGSCINVTHCNCSSEYMTGRSDFAYGSPSCFINTHVVQQLWICVAVINVVMLIHMLACVVLGKTNSRIQKTMAYQTTLVYITGTAQAIYRSVNPLDTIGILNAAPTVLFLVYNTMLIWPTTFYITTVLTTSVKSVPASQLDISKIQRVFLYVNFFRVAIPVIFFAMMILALTSADEGVNRILSNSVFAIYLVCGTMICGIMLPYATTIIISITNRSIKDTDKLRAGDNSMVQLSHKFKIIRCASLALFLFMDVIFVLLGFLPISQRLFSYTMPILSICSASYFIILLEALNIGLGKWFGPVISKLKVPGTSSSVANNIVLVNNPL